MAQLLGGENLEKEMMDGTIVSYQRSPRDSFRFGGMQRPLDKSL